MNLTSGIFTTPRTGLYFFSFSGTAVMPPPSGWLLGVNIYWNGKQVGGGRASDSVSANQTETFSFQTTLNLKAGDEIWLKISHFTPDSYLYEDTTFHYNHFIGWLLEENFSKLIDDWLSDWVL